MTGTADARGTAPLLMVAGGGLAREVAALVHGAGARRVVGVLDDDPALRGGEVAGLRVLGGIEACASLPEADLVITAGRGHARAALRARLDPLLGPGQGFPRVVSPAAQVAGCCEVGEGSVVMAGCVLTADVVVGRHAVLMPGCVLTHDVVLADHVTLAAGVLLAGGVRVGAGAYLGMGCTVREGVTVGDGAVVGMGTAVLHDVPDGAVVVGVPARTLDRRSS